MFALTLVHSFDWDGPSCRSDVHFLPFCLNNLVRAGRRQDQKFEGKLGRFTCVALTQFLDERRNIFVGQRSVMLRAIKLLGKTFNDPLHRVVAGTEARSFCPVQNSAYTLTNAAGSFRSRQPDRGKRAQNIRSVDLIDKSIPERWKHKPFEGIDPLRGVFLISPCWEMFGVNQACSFGESGHSSLCLLLGNRITTRPRNPP